MISKIIVPGNWSYHDWLDPLVICLPGPMKTCLINSIISTAGGDAM